MKKLIVASIAIKILLLLSTFADFLSLHDIKADYVSKSVLSSLHIETSAMLPLWTDPTLEWLSVASSRGSPIPGYSGKALSGYPDAGRRRRRGTRR